MFIVELAASSSWAAQADQQAASCQQLPQHVSFNSISINTIDFFPLSFVSHQWYCFLLLQLLNCLSIQNSTVLKIKLMQINLLWKILSWTNTNILTNTFVSIYRNYPQNSLLCDWTTYHWLQGKCARINLSQAASGMILQNHRRLSASIFSVKIAALGSLKRVIGRILKISNFKGALIFSSTKQQKIAKTFSTCTESNYLL